MILTPNFTSDALKKLLEDKFNVMTFEVGFNQPLWGKLIGWPEKLTCCGHKMWIFTASWKSSGTRDTQHPFYGCIWCGRVE